MTDNEIIKVLTQYAGTYANYGVKQVAQEALSLINRLQAENERLMKEKAKVTEDAVKIIVAHKTAKTEGYKEFAERLKSEIRENMFAYPADEHCEYIDNLVKEMVGDDNEKV